jgi:hypothetical protein
MVVDADAQLNQAPPNGRDQLQLFAAVHRAEAVLPTGRCQSEIPVIGRHVRDVGHAHDNACESIQGHAEMNFGPS